MRYPSVVVPAGEGSQSKKLRGRLVPGIWAPDPTGQIRAARQGGRHVAFVQEFEQWLG
jgi:hypothetical protein